MPLGNAIALIAVAAWGASMAVVWLGKQEPAPRSDLVRSMSSVAWPETATSPLVKQPLAAPASAGSGVQVASVESMIGGLEARLAAQPGDANGWALLAQSYAYTADADATERAMRRAVELGVDEQALRQRIDGAKRSAHPFGPPSVEER